MKKGLHISVLGVRALRKILAEAQDVGDAETAEWAEQSLAKRKRRTEYDAYNDACRSPYVLTGSPRKPSEAVLVAEHPSPGYLADAAAPVVRRIYDEAHAAMFLGDNESWREDFYSVCPFCRQKRPSGIHAVAGVPCCLNCHQTVRKRYWEAYSHWRYKTARERRERVGWKTMRGGTSYT